MKNVIFIAVFAILFVGCAQKTEPIIKKVAPPIVADVNRTIDTRHVVKQKHYPKPPQKAIKLKTVKDDDFNSDYMYPTDSKKKSEATKIVSSVPKVSIEMTKEECISMITKEKFDKYTAMFGSESASIRRCKMLKAKSQNES